jgi:hypothetical protein
MKFSRIWAMPSADTFSIPPIAELLRHWLAGRLIIVDPFARNNRFANLTNDLNPNTAARHHMDAIEFLDMLEKGRRMPKPPNIDAVLFDPPYSPRQISEVYKQIGRAVTGKDTQNAALYKNVKMRLNGLLAKDGIAICCGWNSAGMGKGYETARPAARNTVATRSTGRCRDCGSWGPRAGNGLGLNCGCALE